MVVAYKGWRWPTDDQAVSYQDDAGWTWYRVDCSFGFGSWIEQHSNKLWKIDNPHDWPSYWVHEKLMGLMLLKGV